MRQKYPMEAAAVTIPVAMVLVSFGKCLPTSETGTPIAVAPKAIPMRTQELIENKFQYSDLSTT